MTVIDETITGLIKPGQSYGMVRLLTAGGETWRVSIKVDAYKVQSYARASRWSRVREDWVLMFDAPADYWHDTAPSPYTAEAREARIRAALEDVYARLAERIATVSAVMATQAE